jgi:hypothetical protein
MHPRLRILGVFGLLALVALGAAGVSPRASSAQPASWVPLGGHFRNAFVGPAGIFAQDPARGDDIYRYDEQARDWVAVGGPALFFAVGDHLFGAYGTSTSDPDVRVLEWDGQPGAWLDLQFPAPAADGINGLYAGPSGLFVVDAAGTVFQYAGAPGRWTSINDAFLGGFAIYHLAVGDSVYAGVGGGTAILRYAGQAGRWDVLAGDPSQSEPRLYGQPFACYDTVCVVFRDDQSLRAYMGGGTWAPFGPPGSATGASYAGGNGGLFRLQAATGDVEVFQGDRWAALDRLPDQDPAQPLEIVGGWSADVHHALLVALGGGESDGQSPGARSVWLFTGFIP